jgi:hypothetical protein
MSPAAEHLRARIAEVLKQGPGVRRYGAELKHAVVEYAFVRKDEGATIRESAQELGLSAGVLGRWLRHARLRLKKGRIPFEPSEPSMLDPTGSAAEPSAASLVRNDGLPPEQLPMIVLDYLERTSPIPDLDLAVQRRAESLFGLLGPEILMVLGFYSLPASYAARKGVQVLYRTAYLLTRPVRRVFETTQMVVDVLSPDGLAPTGRGIRTAQKVRLLHASIRHLVRNDPAKPWDPDLGVPINQEDLAGTLTTFAWVVLDGLAKLKIEVSEEDREAYVSAWGVIGALMGVRADLIPRSFAEAEALAKIIHARQIAPSPEGSALTKALIEGYKTIVPKEFLQGMPASMIHFFLDVDPFIGQNLTDMLDVPRADWTESLTKVATFIGHALEGISKHFDIGAKFLRWFGLEMIKAMLLVERGGNRPSFAIPETLRAQWEIGD